MKHTLIIAAAAAAITASCSSAPTPATPATPTTQIATSTTQIATSSPAATPSPTAPPSPAQASAKFVGNWHVHGSNLVITPTTATIKSWFGSCGPGIPGSCNETDTLTVVSGDDTQVTLQLTATSYTNDKGAEIPDPNAPAVGDEMRMDYQAPGLLKTTILQGFPGWKGGNPYWCGVGITPPNTQKCGA